MTQKTIKAINNKEVTYKLIRDGYKTITNSFIPDDNTPSTMTLPTPSEVYTSNLQYTVDTTLNGEPILNFDSFISPDNETVESAQYCYAPKGRDYNYEVWIQEQKIYDNFTAVGSINLDENTGIVTNFSNDNYVQIPNSFNSDNITEAQVCFITGSDVISTQPFFLSSKNDNTSSFAISNGTLYFVHKEFGSLGNYQSLGLFVSENTKYWFKFTQNSNVITSYLSTDGVNFTQGNSVSRSRDFTTLIGSGVNNDESTAYFTGSLDLSDMYIKINNQTWWTPYTSYSGWENVQIPGMLDESVTTDNWNQSQNYKLYQLKNKDDTNSLQLTENNITSTDQKYRQYIQNITVPARDYKYYYHNVHDDYSNVTKNGSVSYNLSTGLATGFNSTNYLYTTINLNDVNNLEIYIKFKPTVNASNNAFLTNNSSGASIFRNDNLKLATWSSQQYIYGYPLTINEKYWAKAQTDDKGIYYLYGMVDNGQSLDEVINDTNNWTLVDTSQASYIFVTGDNKIIFGRNSDVYSDQYFNGELYMDCAAILQNDELIWSSETFKYVWLANKSIYTYTQNDLAADILDFSQSYIGVNNIDYHKYINPKVCLMPIDGGEIIGNKEHQYLVNCDTTYDNFTKIGSPVINQETGIASNFSTSNYLVLPQSFDPQDKSWKFVAKISLSSYPTSSDVYTQIVGGYTYGSEGFELGFDPNGKLRCWLGTAANVYDIDNGSPSSYTFSLNTIYWIKVEFDGQAYTISYSLDGENYIVSSTIQDNRTIYGYTKCLGVDHASNSAPFFGSIYLSETKIYIDNQIWWVPFNVTSAPLSGCTYNYTDDGSANNFDVYYDSNYTQPILVETGDTYSSGTKVDTISLPAHKIWEYTSGGIWTEDNPVQIGPAVVHPGLQEEPDEESGY